MREAIVEFDDEIAQAEDAAVAEAEARHNVLSNLCLGSSHTVWGSGRFQVNFGITAGGIAINRLDSPVLGRPFFMKWCGAGSRDFDFKFQTTKMFLITSSAA